MICEWCLRDVDGVCPNCVTVDGVKALKARALAAEDDLVRVCAERGLLAVQVHTLRAHVKALLEAGDNLGSECERLGTFGESVSCAVCLLTNEHDEACPVPAWTCAADAARKVIGE